MILFYIIGLPIVVTYAMTLIYEKGEYIGSDISKLPYLLLIMGLFAGMGFILMKTLPRYGWWSGRDYGDDGNDDSDQPSNNDDVSWIKSKDL